VNDLASVSRAAPCGVYFTALAEAALPTDAPPPLVHWLDALEAAALAAELAAGARLFWMFERDLPIFVVPALGVDAASCALAGNNTQDDATTNTNNALSDNRFIFGLHLGVLGLCVALCSCIVTNARDSVTSQIPGWGADRGAIEYEASDESAGPFSWRATSASFHRLPRVSVPSSWYGVVGIELILRHGCRSGHQSLRRAV
jgi:hypothetical protein